MKSVAFHNLGCKVNGYEMDYMQQSMKEKGYCIVPFDGKADIYIINTCTVTNIADRKSRQMIHQAKKRNPGCIVVAVGCYVQAGGEEALKDQSIDLAIGNNRKKDLALLLEEYLAAREGERQGEGTLEEKTLGGKSVIDIAGERACEPMGITCTAEHTRAYIKVQDGCNQFCTYCIIPYARGRVRSRGLDEVAGEVKALAGNGYREVVLTGIHLSSYGMEGGGGFSGSSLLSLVQAVGRTPGIGRIRLGSLEPRIITPQFVKGLRDLPGLCPHFHLSLQSGCASVLKRMNRHYTPKEYLDGVECLRAAFAHPAITTDVIVGFPGETDEEFAQTVQFVKDADFYEMHIFKYSRRKGTKAAVMPNQVPEHVKTERSMVLQELEAQMSEKFRQYYIGKNAEVLFEECREIGGKQYFIGHTREYVKAALECGSISCNLENQLIDTKMTGFADAEILTAEIE